jgi:predicted  nucleic acid-binding Zn-ribbon protein
LGASKRARDAAYTALETKLNERLDADPKVLDIQNQILAVDAKIKEIQAQLDDMRKP